MQTLEQQFATIVTEPEYQDHAEFVRYYDNAGIESVKVSMVGNNGDRIYLGDLEVNDGELLFNLNAKAIVEMDPRYATDSIHVPLNVFAEIAAYRLTPQEEAKATA